MFESTAWKWVVGGPFAEARRQCRRRAVTGRTGAYGRGRTGGDVDGRA
ncbi:hypothetical protein OG871_17580 [Kitasatospora sp. NBC_00374]